MLKILSAALATIAFVSISHAQSNSNTDEILRNNPNLETRWNPANGKTEIVERGSSDVVYSDTRDLDNPNVSVQWSPADGKTRAIDRQTGEQVSQPEESKPEKNQQ